MILDIHIRHYASLQRYILLINRESYVCISTVCTFVYQIDTEKLFSNLRYIIYANSSFWCEYLLPVVAEARKTRQPLNPTLMTEGFLKVHYITSIRIEMFDLKQHF